MLDPNTTNCPRRPPFVLKLDQFLSLTSYFASIIAKFLLNTQVVKMDTVSRMVMFLVRVALKAIPTRLLLKIALRFVTMRIAAVLQSTLLLLILAT